MTELDRATTASKAETRFTRLYNVLIDFVALAEAEIQGQRTGRCDGLRMRDCLGQWEATVKEAKEVLYP